MRGQGNPRSIRWAFVLIAFGVLLFVGLQHLSAVLTFLRFVLELLSPFILGLCIAFILSVPLRGIETRLFSPLNRKFTGPVWNKLRRPLALVLTLLLAFGVLAVVLLLVIPELSRTCIALADSIPGFLAWAQKWLTDLGTEYPQIQEWIASVEINWQAISDSAISWLETSAVSVLNSAFRLIVSAFNGVFNFIMGFIFALYVLLQKEHLSRQIQRVCHAYVPDDKTAWLLRVGRMSNRTFSRFITGQCLEAVILGLLFFVTMLIFRFPYALMISVLITITALIPIFGAFIGCFVGAFLILVNDPIQAVWFVVMFLILQQIEGNLIYPKVVGNSVGLPSIWVLVAVTLGGSLMGIFGMLVFVPLGSVLYCLSREAVDRRLRRCAAVVSPTGGADPAAQPEAAEVSESSPKPPDSSDVR